MADVHSGDLKINYRPDGWTNPYENDVAGQMAKLIFEAGADAMLNMLLKQAQEYRDTIHHYMRHDDYLCDVLARGIKL